MFVWFQDEMTINYGTHKNCFKTELFSWWYICINRICNNRRLIGALFQIIVIARHLLLKRLSPLVSSLQKSTSNFSLASHRFLALSPQGLASPPQSSPLSRLFSSTPATFLHWGYLADTICSIKLIIPVRSSLRNCVAHSAVWTTIFNDKTMFWPRTSPGVIQHLLTDQPDPIIIKPVQNMIVFHRMQRIKTPHLSTSLKRRSNSWHTMMLQRKTLFDN